MGRVVPAITDELQAYIAAQPMFFVATAPLAGDGHINVSPKGHDTFAVLAPNRVAYLDLTGSGSETAAHLLENARITFMFCSFSGPPRILRLYGRGRSVLPTDPAWPELFRHFAERQGMRQIVVAEITRVQTSCGFGVPLMDYRGERDTLVRWAEAKGEDGLSRYRSDRNAVSIDGLPTPFAEHAAEQKRGDSPR